jgi:hypothetical protein
MQGPMKIQIPPWRELHHVQPVNRPPVLRITREALGIGHETLTYFYPQPKRGR